MQEKHSTLLDSVWFIETFYFLQIYLYVYILSIFRSMVLSIYVYLYLKYVLYMFMYALLEKPNILFVSTNYRTEY